MASHSIKAIAVLAAKSGIPKDAVVNDFYFLTADDPPTSATWADLAGQISGFYNNVGSTFTPLANYIGNQIDRATQVQVHFTDITGHLDGSPAGSPIATEAFTLAGSADAGSSLPSEVSLCISYQAVGATFVPEFGPGHSRPRSRYRGRLYIGPMSTSSLSHDSHNVVRPSTDCVQTLADAASHLIHEVSSHGAWAQWSRKDAVMRAVLSGWVDNAYDTQRRRGEVAGSRVFYS